MKIINLIINRVQRYSFICYSYSMQFCQKLKPKTKKYHRFVIALLSPFLVFRWAIFLVLEHTFGSLRMYVLKNEESNKIFENELSIVAIVKNESVYIKEWIEFHKIVGVTKFYIYDNASDDNLKDAIQSYIESGEVVYTFYPGKSKQLPAYNDALKKYKNESRYMAFIDLDEFLVPSTFGHTLVDSINEILENNIHSGGIGVTWRIFGSSGKKLKPDGLVTENYLLRGIDKCWQNYHIKTVCNPRFVKEYTSPHFPTYILGAWNINENGRRLHAWFPLGQVYDKIKINHYFCKSKQEAMLKWNRGLADRENKYDWKKFEDYDLNDIYDDGMLLYTELIKRNLD